MTAATTPADRPSRRSSSRQVVLAARPDGIPQAEHFEIRTAPVAAPGPGQLLVRNEYLSVDPAMRGWVSAVANYSEPVGIGEVMRSFAVGVVEESRHDGYAVGDRVVGMFGWQEWATVDAGDVVRTVTETDLAPTLALGVLGLTGVTAWFVMTDKARPVVGDTVVVSTAAGAVGSVAGQLAGLAGCRTVGIAGGPVKAAICTDEFGYDVALDYRSPTFAADLAAACPDGVDVYVDNTSGPISDAVMRLLAPHARVVVCGTASVEAWDPWPQGPVMTRQVLVNRASVEGFLYFDYEHRQGEAITRLARLVRAGRLAYREDILDGIETAPGSIAGLYRGENLGKRLIRLAP